MRRPSALAVFALAAALLSTGCDNNPHPAALRTTRADGSPWEVRYQSLRADPRSFDPQYTYDQMSRKVIEGVYDTLLEYHPMKTAPYELRPCILAEMPLRADDGLSYLFRLKPDIRFHDDPCFPGGKGREIVAEDMQYVFQRICDPKVESPFESTFEEYVVGVAETYEAAKKAERLDYDKMRVDGVEVLDRYSFRLRLKKKYPQILYWFAYFCTAPVAREAVEHYDGKIHDGERRGDFHKFTAVGTGPYRVVSYTPRARAVLERVPGYKTTVFPSDGFPPEKAEWLKTLAGKPLPFIDEVQMIIQPENIPRFVLLRQGYLDGMAVDKDSFNSMVSPVRALSPEFSSRGMSLEKDFEICTFWQSFNMDDPIVGKNVKLRKAIARAYDGARYSEIFYSGVPPVPTQLVPVGIFGHEKDRPAPFAYDVEKARQLLAEAGYPGGRDASGNQLELTLTDQVDGSEYRQRAEFDQRGIEALGIKVKVNGVTFAKLQDIEDKGDFQIIGSSGWGADYPDPENFFMLYYSKNIPPAGKNYARYRNPEYDRAFEQMAAMDNGPARLELVRKLQKFLDDDCPMFPTFTKAFYTAVQPWARRTHDNLMWEVECGIKFLTQDRVMRERLRREWNRPLLWPAYALGALGLGAVLAFIRAVRRSRNKNV
jgi:oligopeptide transport system substrate-binding protein